MPEFKSQRHSYWANVSDENWNNWTWHLQNKVTTIEQLIDIAKSDPSFHLDIEDVKKTQTEFHFGITPYYFSLIELSKKNCPIGMQALPSSEENTKLENELLDFPKEEQMMPVPGLTHRYPDRVMLYTTHHCAVYCRFCTRKRKVSNPTTTLNSAQIQKAVEYIQANTQIREIILSGGDIFSYSDKQLDELIRSFREIPHIEIIRLGTRNLVTLPQRVTPALLEVLKKYPPLYIHTHFNHANECTEEAKKACQMLRQAGCVVNNHTVLLKGINDSADDIERLNEKLLLMGVQPYYLYHCDLTYGSHHFRTKINDDLALIRELRRRTDWNNQINIPHYMIDTPGGGKVELN